MHPVKLLTRRRGRRPFGRTHADELIRMTRDLARGLAGCRPAELVSEVENVRQALSRGLSFSAPEILVAGIALGAEALRRSHGVQLYDVQLLAVLQLVAGKIAQMQTGEGKTFAAIVTSAHFALCGRGVHVMTPNSYLAERDCEEARSVLQQLGMTVGQTVEQGEPASKRTAYDCDVTYGTGHEFGFDYLRDQLQLRQEADTVLGTRLLHDLRSDKPPARITMQRGLVFAIVDEADSVMIDDAASPLVLSMGATGTASDAAAHVAARELSRTMQPGEHFEMDASAGRISLTAAGRSRCYAEQVQVPTQVLLRPWTAYVEQALRAMHLFRRDTHYIVTDSEVRIVDQTTGRIFDDRSWQEGLHQAIEAQEGVPITPEKESLAQITRQRFFRLYQNLCGMTGTATGCEAEFNHVYRCEVADIPLHRRCVRQLLPSRFFVSRQDKLNAIAEDVTRRHATGQPLLIGTQSIADSEAVAQRLQEGGLRFELLNGLQTAEEAEIVSRAGQLSSITIATNLAGRGTDIVISEDVRELGGLHVIVAECQLSGRMDRQLIGRCARQGQPGAAQIFVSAEDALIVRFGQWLGEAIRREAGLSAEADADFSKPLARLQKTAEKQLFLSRAELLRQDIARDSLFGGSSADPDNRL